MASLNVLVPFVQLFCVALCLSVDSRDLVDTDVHDCSAVKPIFLPKNISQDIPDLPVDGSNLSICRSRHSCCTPQMEESLRSRVRSDLQSLLHHSSQTVQGLLFTTATTLHSHVTQLARSSENKTLTLFSEAYSRMLTVAQPPVSALYGSLLGYLNRSDPALPSSIPSGDAGKLQDLVQHFFAQLFPLVYHQAVNLHATDFTEDYKSCLRKAMPDILPFGEYPRDIALDVAKTFEETKVLLEALLLGADVLNTTDLLMASGGSPGLEHCHEALMRLHYCPRCQGLPASVKPCNGYCLNVMRGCLTLQRANDLDLPWNNFLSETERLVRQTREHSGVEAVLRTLTTRISDAIMHASINGPHIEKKVKKACGQPRLVAGSPVPDQRLAAPGASIELPGVTVSSVAHGYRERYPDSPLDTQLSLFLDAVSSTHARGFYANLADSLCSDESFAETRDTAECWNGLRVGEYTKTLVRPGVDAQKYNPELTWTESKPDPKISQLNDKLRHMRQVVLSQLSQSNQLMSDSFVRGEEGSGSGHWESDDDDPARDSWNEEGSGSGHGDITEDNMVDTGPNKLNPSVKTQGDKNISAGTSLHNAALLTITLVLLPLTRWH